MDQGQVPSVLWVLWEKAFLVTITSDSRWIVLKQALKHKKISKQAFYFPFFRFLRQNREQMKQNKTHKRFCLKLMLQKNKWTEAMKIWEILLNRLETS